MQSASYTAVFFLVCVLTLVYPCGAFLVRKRRRQQTKTNTITENQITHKHMVFSLTSIYSAPYWQQHLAELPAPLLMVKDSQTWSLNVITATLYGVGNPYLQIALASVCMNYREESSCECLSNVGFLRLIRWVSSSLRYIRELPLLLSRRNTADKENSPYLFWTLYMNI